MALGGYKFAGYKSTKGSMTTAEWCLQIHKTRLKAFMEANALSNAGWSFDQTGGTIAFENYGNVIYSYDEIGYNLVSFLKHGNDGYLALCSFFQYASISDHASGTICIQQRLYSYSNRYVGMENTLFQRLSKTQLTISNILSSVNRSTTLVPVPRMGDDGSRTITAGETGTYAAAGVYYGGFAIKNGNMIEIAGLGGSSKNIFVSSIGGIKNTLSDDKNDIITLNFTQETSHTVYETNVIYSSSSSSYISKYGTQTLTKTGMVTQANVIMPVRAKYGGDIQIYPFEGFNIFTVARNADGNYLKGVVDVDLVAMNTPTASTEIPANSKVVANGNYLTVHGWSNVKTCACMTGSIEVYPCVFVGWDPDNPQNITDDSAWTEYN